MEIKIIQCGDEARTSNKAEVATQLFLIKKFLYMTAE